MPPTDGPTSGAPDTVNRTSATATIANLLDETRSYPAPADIAATANVGPDEWARAAADPVAFWEEQANRLDWTTPWHTAHTWEPARPVDGSTAADHTTDAASAAAQNTGETSTAAEPAAEPEPELTIPAATWFAGGTLNVAVNCVDRHVVAGRGDKVALHFEGEPGDRRSITYAELQREVAKAANALTALGIGKGDRVVIYLPVIPETVIATLAVARIGAIHSLVFGGFSAEALRFRVEDTEAKLLITTDGQYRRGTAVPVKQNADAAVAGVPSIEHVLVVARTGDETPNVPWTDGRDVWWHETVGLADDVHEAESFDAETPLFIIYTSGTTGKPKGLVHTAGGYLTQASWTHWAIFDAKDDDVHWCTADLAWVTAHTYEIYGPLSNGLTQVIYEGTPNTPHQARHFEIIERYGVTVYYTAPTLIRTLMTWFPDGPPAEYDLSSIRLLGTVGEAINPEAWMWFRDHLGRGETPVIDTWWQSETGSAVIAPLPGATTIKPGSGSRALPGLEAIVVDEDGETVPYGSGGYLVVSRFGPSLARTVWGNPERYRDSYWAKYWRQGYFFSGDGAKWDEDGDIWVLGRVDDVINVSGHRLSTIEVESSLVTHPHVGEAGVVGVDDPITGQAIAAFVIPASRSHGPETDDDAYWLERTAELREALRAHVANEIGPIAKPRDVFVVPDLPKTRSGKIMRRLLGDIVDGRVLGDTTSLQDEAAPHRIASIVASSRAASATAVAARG